MTGSVACDQAARKKISEARTCVLMIKRGCKAMEWARAATFAKHPSADMHHDVQTG